MATKTLWELMAAVESRLDSLGIRATSELTSGMSPPFALVEIPPVDSYRAAFARGTVVLSGWPITIFTSLKVDRIGRRALAEYLSWTGDNSVIKAFEDERTLGGVVSDLVVNSSRQLNTEEVAALQYFGGEIRLTVMLPGI